MTFMEGPVSGKISAVLILFLSLFMLGGCGGGGGSSAGPNAQATITLTPSKTKALANGIDSVTIQVDVRNADGTTVSDDTVVAFSASDTAGTLSAAEASTISGRASVTLTCSGVQTISVTGSAAGATGTTSVKFIRPPTSAEVSIAFDQAVTNLAALSFKLDNTLGATFDNVNQPVSAVNAAAGASTFVMSNFNSTINANTIGLINGSAGGINTGTAPIIKAVYAIGATDFLPAFAVDTASAATFTAADPHFAATVPPVAAANLVVTVTFNSEQTN